MEHCRLQFGCLVVLLYIGFIYLRECRQYHMKLQGAAFDDLLGLVIFCVMSDAATAYTVNNLDKVPPLLNTVLHAMFLVSLDLVIFSLFLYMLNITDRMPRSKRGRWTLYGIVALTVVVIIAFIGKLEYRVGATTNYSMGVSAYVCFAAVILLELLSLGAFLRGCVTFTHVISLLATTSLSLAIYGMELQTHKFKTNLQAAMCMSAQSAVIAGQGCIAQADALPTPTIAQALLRVSTNMVANCLKNVLNVPL